MSSLPNIKILPRKAPFSIIVRIIFLPNHLGPKEVHFDLYLEGKYPFQSPKLYCESVDSFPSVSDGRDLIEELLQSRWSPSITCSDIINKIPEFYSSCILPNQEILFSINFGKYHLGSPYLLDLWYKKEGMNSYYCTENDLNNWKFVKERMIVVTHTTILIFELNTQIIDVGYLLSWATIQSLGSIKRAMSEPDRLTFEWKKIGDSEALSQQFKVPQASEMIELISRNMKRIIALSKERESRQVFSEEDVTGKLIKNTKIADVLETIKDLENELEVRLRLHGINQLMELYQHVIEYYTATDSLEFQVYLKKLHYLLSDEKIAAVLQNGEMEKSTDKVVSLNAEPDPLIIESELKEADLSNLEKSDPINSNEAKEETIQEGKKELINQEEEEKKEEKKEEENEKEEETKSSIVAEKDTVNKEPSSIDTTENPALPESIKSLPSTTDISELVEPIKTSVEIPSQSLDTPETSLSLHEIEETKKEIREIVEKFEIGEFSSEDEANS